MFLQTRSVRNLKLFISMSEFYAKASYVVTKRKTSNFRRTDYLEYYAVDKGCWGRHWGPILLVVSVS